MPKKLSIPASDPLDLAEALLERAKRGDLAFTKREVKSIAAMLDKLSWRMGEAYQVAGNLASFAHMKDDPVVIRALDLLADPMRPGRINFVTKRHREEHAVIRAAIEAHEDLKKVKARHRRRTRRKKGA